LLARSRLLIQLPLAGSSLPAEPSLAPPDFHRARSAPDSHPPLSGGRSTSKTRCATSSWQPECFHSLRSPPGIPPLGIATLAASASGSSPGDSPDLPSLPVNGQSKPSANGSSFQVRYVSPGSSMQHRMSSPSKQSLDRTSIFRCLNRHALCLNASQLKPKHKWCPRSIEVMS
jgi:hypothetical protein